MKRTKLILIALIYCLSTSYGQLGIQGGLNITKLQATPQNGTISGLANFQAGIFYDVLLTNHWYITPGLKYIAKGAFHEGTVRIGTLETKIKSTTRFHYLELPYDIAYRLDSGWFVGGGFYFAYGLDASGAQFGHSATEANPIDLGYSFKLGKKFTESSITLHYSQSLSNISQIENTTLYNQVFSLTGAHHFHRKKSN